MTYMVGDKQYIVHAARGPQGGGAQLVAWPLRPLLPAVPVGAVAAEDAVARPVAAEAVHPGPVALAVHAARRLLLRRTAAVIPGALLLVNDYLILVIGGTFLSFNTKYQIVVNQ